MEIGAARRHDTCIFWTGVPTGPEDALPARGQASPDAVCYPPTGLVPLSLLSHGKVPWTIAPDTTRFQPTAETRVRMWRVRIDRPADADWKVERLSEVSVKASTVDCTQRGEPFCVIFWPDLPRYFGGDQFEVEVLGLRGPSADLAFFYELRSFVDRMLDNSLYAEAARIRATFGNKSLWGEPVRRIFKAGSRSSLNSVTIKVSPRSPRGLFGDKRASRRASIPAIVDSTPFAVEMISHHKTTIVTSIPDVTILLRCKQAAALSAMLLLMHFGGEEEEVPCAVQVQKLPGQHFLLLLKTPMGRRHYELRFRVSCPEAPEDMMPHPFSYTITTTDLCPSLLASLEDSNACKFGYTPVSPLAQTHGIVVLAPQRRRVLIGQCYFLVYVDRALAREEAEAHAVAQGVGVPAVVACSLASASPTTLAPGKGGSPTAGHRCSVANSVATSATAEAGRAPAACEAVLPALFSQRLLLTGRAGGAIGGCVADVHKALSSALSSHTQDVDGDVHLDVSIHNGECVHRLRERSDMPGLFEGLITFSGVDASHMVRLTMRFPRIHAIEYAPRVISEWLTCRSSENLPNYF